MKRTLLVAAVVSTVILAGCSKALTESRASGVIQKWIDGQNRGTVNTFAGLLPGQIGAEMPNPWTAAAIQRLLKQGYLEQKTVSVAYPNLSGQYSDVREDRLGFAVSRFVDTYDLQTVANTRPPHVEGSFRSCFFNNCDAGSVSGVVTRNAPSALTLQFRAKENFISDRIITYNRSLVVTLQRGQPDCLVGRYSAGSENPFVGAQSFPIRADHVGPNPPDIQQEVYVYSWTTKLPKDTLNGAMLKLGHLVVDSCDRLLLSTETTASASCKTHVSLTSAAEIIFGKRPTDQLVQASFGKQPDGTWVGTQISYSAPPFDINQ